MISSLIDKVLGRNIARKDRIDALVGKGCVVENIEFRGSLHVYGMISGKIKSTGADSTLIITDNGVINAEKEDLQVDHLVIENGVVICNNVKCKSISVSSTGALSAKSITYQQLVMESGATVNGALISSVDPLKKSVAQKATVAQDGDITTAISETGAVTVFQ